MPPKRSAASGKRKSTTAAAESPEPKKRKTSSSQQSESKPPKPSSSKPNTDMPLAPRTSISSLSRRIFIGAHVSAAGGVHNALPNAVHIGGNALALFLKSQRKWTSPPLSPEVRDQFHAGLKEHGYSPAHILPHGSYLVNLAQPDPAKAAQAYANFVDDLGRCDDLGITLYNFHPGSTGGQDKPAALSRIAAQLNKAHAATKSVVTVLENMAGAGNVIGGPFSDLATIIDQVDQKHRVGVCIDTCHAFAAGHDLRTPDSFAAVMSDFDSTIGYRYLRALHLNDSKAPFASNRDVHANIGTGFLGLGAFHSVVNHPQFQDLPMVLETPIDRPTGPKGKMEEDKQVWADEIKLLERLVGMDRDGEEFKELERELSARGAEERKKFQDQADRKMAKGSKAAARNSAAAKMMEQFAGKGRKKAKVEEEVKEESEKEEEAAEEKEEEEVKAPAKKTRTRTKAAASKANGSATKKKAPAKRGRKRKVETSDEEEEEEDESD